MIDVDEAYKILFAHVRPVGIECLELAGSLGRILAESVRCDIDYPPFDRSIMDGYAVQAADTQSPPVQLALAGAIAAGATPDRRLESGEAMQINTGAPVPEGADAVVRVEDSRRGDGERTVIVQAAVRPGQFIARRADFVAAGETIVAAGTRLTPAELGAAAAAGAANVTVHLRPKVAILATGTELVDVDRVPAGGQIRNSNQFLLEALVQSAGASAMVLQRVDDDESSIRRRIHEGLCADMLLITGGISMGPLDLVPAALKSSGARFHIHRMAIKPGRPVIFATGPARQPIFALPGNPMSAHVGFELLVRPALEVLSGGPPEQPPTTTAALQEPLPATRDRRTFVPARAAFSESGGQIVWPMPWRGSGDVLGMCGANAMIMRPPQSPAAEAAALVDVLLLGATRAAFPQ